MAAFCLTGLPTKAGARALVAKAGKGWCRWMRRRRRRNAASMLHTQLTAAGVHRNPTAAKPAHSATL